MSRTPHSSVIILHFNPLERYPPIINLINYLTENSKQQFIVISTKDRKGSNLQPYKNFSENVAIKRTTAVVPSSASRVFSYVYFYSYCLYLLVRHQPRSVFYLETISAWPALIYKKLRGKKVKLFVHYHEYISPETYRNNMRLLKIFHKMEQKMYSCFSWISHTNEIRMNQFRKDYELQKITNALFHLMPNYPSKYWAKKTERNVKKGAKIRLVYAGALGLETMYLREITEWVIENEKWLSLDIYSYNFDEKAGVFLRNIKNESVTFHGSCSYEELPNVLSNYDVGLVIYKTYSENFMQGISNKVYEYLACGLDVWFSKEITYTSSIARNDASPKIIAVDFANLKEFNLHEAACHKGISIKNTEYYYENIYPEILEHLDS